MSTRDAADFLHRAAQFDSKDLRAKIGGLLLLPENASRVARLEFAVHLAASLPPTQTTSTISANDLRQLLNNSIIGHSYMVANEDPVAGMFTEALSFTGGSYVVFPGIVTDAAFITRHLLRALVDPHQAYPDGDFPRHAHDLSLAVLALSNAIAERLGMQRGIAPVERPNDPSIEVPDDPKLSRYAKHSHSRSLSWTRYLVPLAARVPSRH
ncbi:MAG: hypothetical protein A49_14760 [Methyloceanibacter sp.]|nr:MAG: hypothetical protein A49_14760 [Methyloceanibacter sp.]